jgi:hypothetical protein
MEEYTSNSALVAAFPSTPATQCDAIDVPSQPPPYDPASWNRTPPAPAKRP